MGNAPAMQRVTAFMNCLPLVEVMPYAQFYNFVVVNMINGTGLGFVDAHLVASLSLHNKLSIWTRDNRLANEVSRLKFSRFQD